MSRLVMAGHGDRQGYGPPMYYGEKFNALTHLVGAVLALAGTVVLIVLAALDGDPWKVVSVSIYGVTLALLYSLSTLYHSVRGRAKNILRELDHHSIYLLIAGTYTPFCLVTLRGPWGWSLLGIVWGLAVLGSLQELTLKSGPRILSVVIYLLMGWPDSPGSRPADSSIRSASSSLRSTPVSPTRTASGTCS